jgi:hypothetical protein
MTLRHDVVGGGTPSRDDLEAAALLDRNEANRLQLVRTRAEKWLGGLTALTGLVTTVLVIKGPQSTADIATSWKIAVGSLIALALVVLVFGTFRAYQSAYGDPGRLDEVKPQPVTGLAVVLASKRNEAAAAAQAHLRHAAIATLAAVVVLAVAIGLTWFAPPAPKTASGSVCILVRGTVIAELASDSVTLKTLSPGTELRRCPATTPTPPPTPSSAASWTPPARSSTTATTAPPSRSTAAPTHSSSATPASSATPPSHAGADVSSASSLP